VLWQPWRWAEEEWRVGEWEYASGWGGDFGEFTRFGLSQKFVRRREWTRLLARAVCDAGGAPGPFRATDDAI